MFETIRSLQNNRVKHLVRLRESSHRRRQKRFLVEGQREFERALETGWPMETVYFCEELFRSEETYSLLEKAEDAGLEMVRLAEEPFRKCAYRQGPDGFLSVALQQDKPLSDLVLSKNPLLVVLEAIEKPGNLGAILRTANAAGADCVILSEAATDPYNPNAIRASQGAFFDLPFCLTENAELAQFLDDRGIRVVATSPLGSKELWEADMTGPTAILLGAEDDGLSPFWLERQEAFCLPMKGVTDSLNVSSTAAVCLFEAVRQRRI